MLEYLLGRLFFLITSKGSSFSRFLRRTSYFLHRPSFIHMISSGNILHASRTHTIIYYHEGGEINRKECLFAIFT